MYSASPYDKKSIELAIDADRADLFRLADKLRAAPLPRWNVWVTDYGSAYFLRRFLSQVLLGDPEPQEQGVHDIPVANSRVRGFTQQWAQQRAIASYLRRAALADRRILLITEIADSGVALRRLADPLLKNSVAQLDLAVLVAKLPEQNLLDMTGADSIYTGRVGIGTPPPRMKSAFGSPEVHGFMTVPGDAQPHQYGRVNATYRQHVEVAYDGLAREYLATPYLPHQAA